MKKYGYASVSLGYGVRMFCTDSQFIAWVLAELEKVDSSYRPKEKKELPPGEIYHFRIDRLRGDGDITVWWWIVRQLCKRGWEPFSEEDSWLSFRFESEE